MYANFALLMFYHFILTFMLMGMKYDCCQTKLEACKLYFLSFQNTKHCTIRFNILIFQRNFYIYTYIG